MTETDFLALLNDLDFPRRYWDLCNRFVAWPTGQANLGRKEDVIAGFAGVGVNARYNARDRSFTFDEERIGDVTWAGVFVKQRHGVELMILGESGATRLGNNFAVLAYRAKRLADPTFERSPFKGPPPYPRPDPGESAAAMREIVKQHVLLVHLIKDALRRRASSTH